MESQPTRMNKKRIIYQMELVELEGMLKMPFGMSIVSVMPQGDCDIAHHLVRLVIEIQNTSYDPPICIDFEEGEWTAVLDATPRLTRIVDLHQDLGKSTQEG